MTRPYSGNQEIDQVASEWVVRRAGLLSADDEMRLQTWIAQDPRHAEAFTRLNRTWSVFDRVRQQGATPQIIAKVAQRSRTRRRRWQTSAVLVTCMLAALLYTTRRGLPHAGAGTVAESVASVVKKLPDGSIVELNRGAEIDVRYDGISRRVVLVKGEAHFRVEKDPVHPFRVIAGRVEVVAVGTAFTVQIAPRDVEVVVTEGRVAIDNGQRTESSSTPAAAAAPTLLDAGNRMVIDTAAPATAAPLVKAMSEAEIDARLAWRVSRVEFEGMELAEAVILMNRANRVQISFDDPAIGKLRVSGAFRTDNPDGFVRIVGSTFDLKAERRGEQEIVLRRL